MYVLMRAYAYVWTADKKGGFLSSSAAAPGSSGGGCDTFCCYAATAAAGVSVAVRVFLCVHALLQSHPLLFAHLKGCFWQTVGRRGLRTVGRTQHYTSHITHYDDANNIVSSVDRRRRRRSVQSRPSL